VQHEFITPFIVFLFLRLSVSVYVRETLIVSRYLFLLDILHNILEFLYKYPLRKSIWGWLVVDIHSCDCNTVQFLNKKVVGTILPCSLDEELMLRTMLQNS